MRYKVEITVRFGDEFRRETVEGERKLITYGLYARDQLEQRVEAAAAKMYRDLAGEIIVEG